MSGLRWLQERGYTDDQIVVAGDSAGGYLAFMTTLAAIRTELAKPAGIATISPFTDPDPARKLKHRNALPPVAIHASSDELLLPDAELMAKRLEAAGIRCDLHLWDGQIHDFPLAPRSCPKGGGPSDTSGLRQRCHHRPRQRLERASHRCRRIVLA
jgi:acetyl esterase/lipase